MSDFLFAYGTLQPGLAPADVAPFVANLIPIGEAFVNGILYDLGGHPGAVLHPSSQQKIIGTVYQLPEDASVLPEFDAYEEFDPAALARSPFIRALHPVELNAGGTLQCWVYVYNRDPGSAPILPGRKYRKADRKRAE